MNFYKKALYFTSKYFSIVRNVSALFSIKTIDLCLSLWLIPFLISKVGIENYGLYAFAMALTLFFVNVLNYGFNLTTVREIAQSSKDTETLQRIFNEVFSVKLILFFALLIAFLLLTFAVPSFYKFKTLYFCCSLLLVADLFSLRWFFMGIEKMQFMAGIHFLGTLSFVFGALLFINLPEDFIFIPLFEAIGLFLTSSISFVWVVKKYNFKLSFLGVTFVFKYLKSNFSSFINLLLPSTYNTILIFMVGLVGLPSYVAFTKIGVRIAGAFSTLNTILTNVFYPLVSRNTKVMSKVRLILNNIGLLSTFLMFLSSYVIHYWIPFDSEANLQTTITIIQYLSVLPFFMAIISSYGVNGLLIIGQDALYGKISFFTFIAMVLASFLLIPSLEIFGGVLALLLGRFLSAFLSFLNYKYKSI